jgi:catechol 2,3-dioxygenase-like lactoylglutathione lyase family enzyme
MFQIIGLDHIALPVRDQERSLEWYQRILGMERRYQEVWSGPQDPVMACAGNTCLALLPLTSLTPNGHRVELTTYELP